MSVFRCYQAKGGLRCNLQNVHLVPSQNSISVNTRTERLLSQPQIDNYKLHHGDSFTSRTPWLRRFTTSATRDADRVPDTRRTPDIADNGDTASTIINSGLPARPGTLDSQAVSNVQLTSPVYPFLSFWSRVKYPIAFVVSIYGAYVSWTFYRSEYNWFKTRLKMELHHRQLLRWLLCGGEQRVDDGAIRNAKFQSDLSSELTYQISVFFLQLDLDKENGVRRSDVMAILKEAGADNPESLEPVKRFVAAGRGRSIDAKRTSGCQLQEVIELFENLLLFDAKSLSELDASFEIKLLEEFKKQTKAASQSVVPSKLQFSRHDLRTSVSSPSSPTTIEADEASEDEILEFEFQRLKRIRDEFVQYQSRRGLAPAQSERLLNIEAELEQLQLEMLKKANCNSIDHITKSLRPL